VVKAFAFVIFITSGLLLAGLLQERYLHLKTEKELAETKAKLTECNTQLDLQNMQIENMKVEYENKLKEFQRARKSVQKIYEPLRIEVPQVNDECTALRQMLEEYKKAERVLP